MVYGTLGLTHVQKPLHLFYRHAKGQPWASQKKAVPSEERNQWVWFQAEVVEVPFFGTATLAGKFLRMPHNKNIKDTSCVSLRTNRFISVSAFVD